MRDLFSITPDIIYRLYQKYEYTLDTREYAINIFGIRSKDNTTGKYSDVIGIITNCPNIKNTTVDTPYYIRRTSKFGNSSITFTIELFIGTTKPGIPNLLKPINPKGAAIIVPGFYPNVWTKGLHKGKYPALIQCGTFNLYRDNNKNAVADYVGPIYKSTGDGINCHHGSITPSIFIGLYSAGCQVIKDTANFEQVFMYHIDNAYVKGQTKFNYALFKEEDIV